MIAMIRPRIAIQNLTGMLNMSSMRPTMSISTPSAFIVGFPGRLTGAQYPQFRLLTRNTSALSYALSANPCAFLVIIFSSCYNSRSFTDRRIRFC